MPPLVSIITPAYNAEKFIRRTIRSVQKQTYPHWEMIVVDDGSKDNTRQIVESIASKDPRVRLIKMPENSGLAAITRNRGLKSAKGEFIAFLDDDDIWHPRKLEIQLVYFEQHPSAQIIATYYKIFGDETRMKDWQGMLWRKPPGIIKPDHLIEQTLLTSTVMLQRELYDAEGGFPHSDTFRFREDYVFFTKLGLKYEAHQLPHTLIKYRLAPKGNSFSLTSGNNIQNVYEAHLLLRESGAFATKKLEQYHLAASEYNIAKDNLFHHKTPFRRYLWRSIKTGQAPLKAKVMFALCWLPGPILRPTLKALNKLRNA